MFTVCNKQTSVNVHSHLSLHAVIPNSRTSLPSLNISLWRISDPQIFLPLIKKKFSYSKHLFLKTWCIKNNKRMPSLFYQPLPIFHKYTILIQSFFFLRALELEWESLSITSFEGDNLYGNRVSFKYFWIFQKIG